MWLQSCQAIFNPFKRIRKFASQIQEVWDSTNPDYEKNTQKDNPNITLEVDDSEYEDDSILNDSFLHKNNFETTGTGNMAWTSAGENNNPEYSHLKTDSEFLHGYTLGLLQLMGFEIDKVMHDIDKQLKPGEETLLQEVKTHYEQKFRNEGKKITYIRFSFA